MKRLAWFIPILLGVMIAATPLVAQNRPVLRVGFLDSEKVIQAHPRYKEVQTVLDQANKELKPITDQLTPLQQKIQAGNATAKEQQDFQTLRNTYQQASQKWNERRAKALEPLTKEIDVQIDKFARAQGFGIILDRRVASASGLVLYGDDSLDVTDEIINALK
ncbi:MAG TPA: OmpH family outer membrane protein [Meiothermus sp.]|jgi:outer membrane protein|nr:OmpH family outer membrane protein [Meiothermus sp.]